ncbi:MAG: hypothetical protein KDC88_13805, partial [Ignavibacteriae bacterium]|nr:hypothetical protein [Ignavibacteriota bacterium]
MKKLFSLFTFLFSLCICAQWEMVQENKSGFINDVDFYNENIGWIKCDYELLLTTDGGDTWKSVYNFEPEGECTIRYVPPIIQDASFFNKSIGWFIYRGRLYQTNNGGDSWELIFESGVRKIQILKDSTIIIASVDQIRKSIDYGNSWTSKQLKIEGEINDLFFINDDYGYAASSKPEVDTIFFYRTTDGGENWKSMKHIAIDNFSGYSNCRNIGFADSRIGYALVYTREYNPWDAILYKTNDSGMTWKKLIENVSSYLLHSNEEIYISINEYSKGKILHSIDHGANWIEKYIKHTFIHDIYAKKNESVYIIEGVKPQWVGSLGLIVNKYDNGFNNETWETVKINFSYSSIKILNDGSWIINGAGGGPHWNYSSLFLTKDAGKNYNLILSLGDSRWKAFSFYDKNNGYYYYQDNIFKTVDGGISWNNVSKLNGYDYSAMLHFITPELGWACNSGIYKTMDGGVNWKKVIDEKYYINSIFFTDESNGWVTFTDYNNDKIMLKYNAVDGWNEIFEFEKNTWIKKIEFIDNQNGIIFGDKLLRTFDSGYSWNEVYEFAYSINDAALSEDGTLWAVGQRNVGKGAILKTENFWDPWFVEVDTFSYPLFAISIKDSLILATGGNGIILKSLNNGLTWLEDKYVKVSSKYQLSQNYPNPFNP